MESKDDAKAAAVITKTEGVKPLADYKGYKRWGMDDDGFAAIGKNAVLIGTSEAVLQQAIDTREGGGAALADAQSFKDTLKELPEDNLGVVYVDGPKLAQLVALAAQAAPLPATGAGAARPSSSSSPRRSTSCASSSRSACRSAPTRAASASAPPRSLDEERAKTLGILTEDFEPSLTGRVPATTLAYFGFQNLGPMLKTTLDEAHRPVAAGGAGHRRDRGDDGRQLRLRDRAAALRRARPVRRRRATPARSRPSACC